MNSQIEELLQWARVHNTSLHDSVAIYQDAITGLSFRSTDDIPAGTRLAISSYETSLSYLNATGIYAQFKSHSTEPGFPMEFVDALKVENPHIIGHFFLIQQYLLGKKSFWWNYIRLLPQPDDPEALGIPVGWPEADLKFLAGTNAEPPIQKKLKLWQNEWALGIWSLRNYMSNWHVYSYKLYQWAASIFGSRSFRASLTIAEDIVNSSDSSELLAMNRDHIRHDHFSVLFPVLDIGNHDGVNRVEWSKSPETGHFTFSSTEKMEQGSQIFNFYGNKSNSELLVGYGFILNTVERDIVNLKMTPAPEAAALRRMQACHQHNTLARPEEELMFYVRRQRAFEKSDDGIIGLQIFSHGLFETLACMVANARERRYIEENLEYCVQNTPSMFSGHLYKALFESLQILSMKLTLDKNKILDTGKELGSPHNQNQRMALEYRARKLAVLDEALLSISQCIQQALEFPSFHGRASTTRWLKPEAVLYIESEVPKDPSSPREAGLLTLKVAYKWLETHYPDLHTSVTEIIAKDQDESLPLKWVILVEDWDHAYWVVWIYIIWMLWARDGSEFLARHANLTTWMNLMKTTSTSSKEIYTTFHANPSEKSTINDTIEEITWLPHFRSVRTILESQNGGWELLRNFASFVARNECLSSKVDMYEPREEVAEEHRGNGDEIDEREGGGEWVVVKQRVLAVC